jgi:asparagine synthase (glutamine-hydrolysing)
MSVQFGIWNFDGKAPRSEHIGKAVSILIPYGPDGQGSFSGSGLFIVYRAFHTTKEARRETQPYRSESDAVITWDGRLDNGAELRQQFRTTLECDCPDVVIVAAAYEQWGTECFAKLLGDWAVSIWIPNEQSLILAKDAIGTRQLYYSFRDAKVTWSSLLEPLVWNSDQSLKLNEEYIAGWLSFFPAPELTPYAGIHAVPPCSFVRIKGGTLSVRKYWDFNADRQIIYQNDAEYEEHFRNAFGEAVRCRLRSDGPLLAELSGGIDSSAIVCMADTLLGHEKAKTTRLETMSYFDDSEPNWNERPFFEKVEERRGRVGCHIDVGAKKGKKKCDFSDWTFRVTPCSGGPAGREFVACMSSVGSRVLLSGIGGDEVTGGVPTPIPELADFIARARFVRLSHQLKVWALNKRIPWFYLLFEVAQRFLPPALVGVPKFKRPAPWLNPDFVYRNRRTLQGYETRLSLFGALPTFQENLSALRGLRRQLACDPLPCAPPYEKRYPYLDRNLLEFLYAIPREQLLRPGQRRSLMRRALVGIVPEEILNRKRKAYVARAPLADISEEWAHLDEMGQNMVSSALGIVDQQRFRETLNSARRGHEVALVTLMRTIAIETWLRSHRDGGLVDVKADNHGFAVAASSTERTSDAACGMREIFSSGEH